MRKLIEELKNNAKINKEKGLENVVNIDYIIERLENINVYEENIKNEIYFNIENIVNDDYIAEEIREKLIKLTDNDIQPIVDSIMYDDYVNSRFNELIESELYKLIREK